MNDKAKELWETIKILGLQNERSALQAIRAALAAQPAVHDIASKICQAVAELPDRNSPEDWPEAMLVTHEELQFIVTEALAAVAAQPEAGEAVAWKLSPDELTLCHSHAVLSKKHDGSDPSFTTLLYRQIESAIQAKLASAPTIRPTQPVQEPACPVCKGAQGWAPGHPCIACFGSGIDPDATTAQAGDAGEPSDDMDAHRANGLAWAVSRWNDEVANRPTVNIHRRTLDGTWRQCIRYFGGDPVKLIGPAHDDLVIARQTPVTSRAQTATRRCGHPLGATRWCPDCETNSATKDQP